jgi:hypothetical protein
MKSFLEFINDMVTSVVGWIGVIVVTVVIGFFVAYWVGHRKFMGLYPTLQASVYLPVIWITWPQMLAVYITTVLAIYLPLRFQSTWLFILAPIVSIVVWVSIVGPIVHHRSDGKFWQW